jgi:pectin methylesterase-like acyl-CoA thioesterase
VGITLVACSTTRQEENIGDSCAKARGTTPIVSSDSVQKRIGHEIKDLSFLFFLLI